MIYCTFCGKPVTPKDMLAELVTAARMGSQDAISALYEKTYSKVYYTVISMIKDEDTVFDIVQDTYIKAFTHLNSFQGDTHFLPWIRQIAANTARDWLKKKRPVLFTEFRSDEEQDTPIEELFPDERSENLPDKVIDQKETERLIHEIIEELPADQHAVIGMFYYEEMSVKEIAAAMDVSESAVKSRLMYGRNKIEKKVRELEKKGTKLYGLSPLPFLLLLFYNQKTYAAKAPAGQILHTILASVSTDVTSAAGAAKNAGTVGARQVGTAEAGQTGAAGVGQASTAAAGQAGAAAAGSLGTLKIGLITVATIVVAGLGIFGVTRIASRSDESWNPLTVEDSSDNGAAETPEASEEPETQEEPTPIDEALEQYRIIISQADSYEYYEHEMNPWTELTGYRYALVQMHPDDPVPTLLLERDEIDIEISVPSGYIRIFQYDPDAKTVRQPNETIGIGIRGGIAMAGDGEGIFDTQWSGGTGQGSVSRITLVGDSLNRETYWTGQIFEMPDSITSTEIEWHEIEDLSALDSFTASESDKAAPSGQAARDTLPTDGERIVLSGTVGTYNYDEILTLQKQPDPKPSCQRRRRGLLFRPRGLDAQYQRR